MEKHYNITQMSSLLNVTVKTLQRWDRDGILIANRGPTNRRFYTHEQYLKASGKWPNTKLKERKTVIYARVSNRNHKDDLSNQVEFLKQFANANGVIVDETIEDIGSGLNYKRKKWNLLLNEVMENKIETIFIAHKDRFVRFGFDWFQQLCEKFGTKMIIVKNKALSPEEELVQDLIAITHVFSCRIYGLRKYKNRLKGEKKCLPTKLK
ncbi:IS607 family transposase [Neobacillus vireti]|uniref:IS607 family transposase n=1 Tax=Neobacillus vireti TaxID=220686 RepID=UPI003B58A4EC